MKRIMNKLIPIALALILLFVFSAVSRAEGNDAYVLMNIPYADFYAAEVTDASSIDAVTSATLMKPRTGTLAGGSYHVNADGSDITGVIFPVYVEDASVLEALGGIEVTEEERKAPRLMKARKPCLKRPAIPGICWMKLLFSTKPLRS